VGVPDVYRALWRRKFLIISLTILVVAGAYYLTKRETKLYTASTLVRVQQRVDNSGEAFLALQTGGRLAQTYANIAASHAIASRIYSKLGKQISPGDVSVAGAQVQDLELMRISATNAFPARAQMIANAAPGALEDFIRSTGTKSDHIIVVDPAGLPATPSSPNVKLNVMMALLLALVFNGALAILIEVLGDRVGNAQTLERIIGKPVLAVFPELALTTHREQEYTAPEPDDGEAVGEVRPAHG
jgi:capsular polysaccharide biosynthesis protein